MIQQIFICGEESNAILLLYDRSKRRVNMSKNVFHCTRTWSTGKISVLSGGCKEL